MRPETPVQFRIEELVFPTYLPAAPDKNPMFLEKRVYQGSSGKVYPLLFDDDLQFRQETAALFLQAQAHLGLGRRAKAKSLFATVLQREPSHALAGDLLAGLRK